MPTNRYFPGSTVSNALPTEGYSWDEVVAQSGKPLLDSEFNLAQAVGQTMNSILMSRTAPSGWVRGPSTFNPMDDFTCPDVGDPEFVENAFYMRKRTALVAGLPVVVAFTSTPPIPSEGNLIELDAAPVNGGAPPDIKRTDFVFLEVFKAVVSPSPRATAVLTVNTLPAPGDQILIAGIPLTAVAVGPAGVDEFVIGGSTPATTTNIVAAINALTNSFTSVSTAQVDVTTTNQINLFATSPGAVGNTITLAVLESVPATFTISGPFFTGGADTPNKPTQGTLYRNGNTLSNPAVNPADDTEDAVLGAETTKRVQIQYRIRVTGQAEAVNFKTQCDGFSNPAVLAWGTGSTGVVGYPFVPADGNTSSSSSDASAYGIVDHGLWIAGDGSPTSASALGTADGFVYAIPLCFVFRRNDASMTGGFDPANNANGGLAHDHLGFNNTNLPGAPIAISAATSDRPDGLFHDVLVLNDILDLRKEVIPGGIDTASEAIRQMQWLLDTNLSTWAIDGSDKQSIGSGSGTVGTKFLVCNEVGRTPANTGPVSTYGDVIGEFDHIRRRFASQPVVEKACFEISPGDGVLGNPGKYTVQANPGYLGWAEGDRIVLDLNALNPTGLGDWDPSSATLAGASVSGFWPSGTTITNILRVIHDDGNYTTAVDKSTQIRVVEGIGTAVVEIELDANTTSVDSGGTVPSHPMVGGGSDNGSQRRIFFEVEVTYPLGAGTTDTPVEVLTPDVAVPTYAVGALIEEFPAIAPTDYEEILAPTFRPSHRELGLEYVANDAAAAPIQDDVVSDDPDTITMWRRIYGGSGAPVITDLVVPGNPGVDTSTPYGSSVRRIDLDTSLSGTGQTLCRVEYYAQDPLPNWGGAGTCFQIAVYYAASAPQTLGSMAPVPNLPDPVTLVPLAMSHTVWTSNTSAGSQEATFPYLNPTEQIAVNADVNTPAGGTYPGDWIFCADAQISVADFSSDTGVLTLHPMVMVDGNTPMTFSAPDMDVEFRAHYKVADPNAYRPVVMAQPLSGPGVHKVWMPFLAYSTQDTVLWRKNEVLLVVITRYASLDANNSIIFTGGPNDPSCASIYRTKGLLLLANQ
jgi:hypothetical protein